MPLGPVPAIARESVTRRLAVELGHHAIPRDLRDNGCRGDANAARVAVDQRRLPIARGPQGKAIHEQVLRRLPQRIDCSPECELTGKGETDLVDDARSHDPDANGHGDGSNDPLGGSALLECQLLGVPNADEAHRILGRFFSRWEKSREQPIVHREHHGCRDYWTSPRPTSSFVHARDQTDAALPEEGFNA